MVTTRDDTLSPFGARRLAAVWFADIVGYTQLASRNERAALRLVGLLQEVARRGIEHHRGELVKLSGDAVLATFGSTELAVRAALGLQAEFAAAAASCGVVARLRVGVHVGDVAVSPDGDVHGDGVNRAARLQAAAPAGAVVVSEEVWRQLRPRTEFRFHALGKRHLKGIVEAVCVFSVALVEEQDGAAPARPSPRRWLWLLAVSAALAVLLLSGAALNTLVRGLLAPDGRPGGLDAELVAVAPFNVTPQGRGLADWGEHLVDILARNLDGAGPLRTVPPSRTLNGWTGPADPASAAALGRRTGAGLVVFGSLIPSGPDSARVTASLLDVASGRVLDEVALEVADPARRMVQLSDSLTVALLEALGRSLPVGPLRGTSLAAATSIPSLKAFLRGEQFFRRTAWDSAIAYYRRAVDEDSTFSLALRRMGQALGWQGSAGDSVVIQYMLRAGAHNHGLSPRDSLLVLADSLAAAAETAGQDGGYRAREYWGLVRRLFATLDEGIRRDPGDPEFWYARGDAGYHFGYGPARMPAREILEAFDRSIALDSAYAAGYLHPIELGLMLGGRERGARYLRAYLALDPAGLNAEGVRIVARLTDARPPPAARSMLDSASADAVVSAGYLLDFWPDSLETAVWLREYVETRRGADRAWRTTCGESMPVLAQRLAFRGHLREAACALGPNAPPGVLFATLALLGGIPADSAAREFDRWLREGAPEVVFALPWWSSTGDTAHVRALLEGAAAEAASGPDEDERLRATYHAASARAHLALARGDTSGALARFTALPDTLCFSCFGLDELLEARLLAARGRYAEAEAILDAWRGPRVSPVAVLAKLEYARLEERLRKRRGAREAYRYVADAWTHADAGLQPWAREGREAVRRLNAERGTPPRPPRTRGAEGPSR